MLPGRVGWQATWDGRTKEFLKINGIWQDHLMFAKITNGGPTMVARSVFLLLLLIPASLRGQATEIRAFLDLLSPDPEQQAVAERAILDGWDDSHSAMLVELSYFAQRLDRSALFALLECATGQYFRQDADRWWNWIWATNPGTHPDYSMFKAQLYASIDPSFRDYFDDGLAAKIRLDEIRWGGVGRDGIPPLDLPDHTNVRGARYLDDDNIVFAIAVNGDERAYPKRIMAWHEMFKDTIGGEHFTGVYCTLCGSMILYRSTIDGEHHELGTSGFLYRSNKLMYDHATRSLWSTLTGGPVVGPLAERDIELEPLAVVTTTWGEWRRRHPRTKVLSIDTGYQRDYSEGAAYRDYFSTDELMFTVPKLDTRLKNKDEVLALRFSEVPMEQLAISVEFLAGRTVYHDLLGAVDFVVLTDQSGASRVYETRGRRFSRWDGQDGVQDEEGERWTLTEAALTSPGQTSLRRLPSHRAFWFGWYAQYPEARLVH